MSHGNTQRCKLVSITSSGGTPIYLKESRNVRSQAEARLQGANLAHLMWGPWERSAAPVALRHTGTDRGTPPAPSHPKGTELLRGDNRRFLHIIQGAMGKRAHTGWDACKLGGTDFEKNGSVSTALPAMLLLLLGQSRAQTNAGVSPLSQERETGGCREILLFQNMKKHS